MGKLRSENELLRSLLTDKEKDGAPQEEPAPVAAKPVSAKEFLRQVADAQYGDSGNGTAAPTPDTAAPEDPAASRERRKTGGMFDLLSIDEV